MTLYALVHADALRQFHFRGIEKTRLTAGEGLGVCLSPRFLPVLLFRLSHGCARQPLRPLGKLLSMLNVVLFGLEIALDAEIGPGLYFPHTAGTVLGARSIGADAVIYHNVTVGAKLPDLHQTGALRPAIGDRVLLGAGCKVLGPIELGDDVTVGANAVVLHSVPSGALVTGVPGRVHP